MATPKPKIELLTTGGTIANPLDVDGYIGGEQLVDDIPEVTEIADISVTDVASVASQELTASILFTLHGHITNAASGDDKPDGFVVTSGSNTNEEIAYFLNLTLDVELPVVTTAAQRNHGMVGNDGDRNLIDAIRVASHPDAEGQGVMLVTNDEIHASRDGGKLVSSRPDAWSSGDVGTLGFTDKHGRVQFYRRSEREHTTETPFDLWEYDPSALRRIRVVYSTLGTDGEMVRAALNTDTDGLVVAAFPTGNPASPTDYPGQEEALVGAAREGTPVVISHRGHVGWTYAYRTDKPFIHADDLAPQKARLLLYLALQETDDRGEIQSFFERF